MRTLTAVALMGLALALAGCSTTGLGDLTSHLNERGCATKGSANANAGITGASLAGNVSWSCPGTPATKDTVADVSVP